MTSPDTANAPYLDTRHFYTLDHILCSHYYHKCKLSSSFHYICGKIELDGHLTFKKAEKRWSIPGMSKWSVVGAPCDFCLIVKFFSDDDFLMSSDINILNLHCFSFKMTPMSYYSKLHLPQKMLL